MRIKTTNFLLAVATILVTFLGTTTYSAENEAPPQTRQQRPANRERGQRRGRGDDVSLVAGQMAPEFKLKSVDGKQETTLESLRQDKPVILFFGSYT